MATNVCPKGHISSEPDYCSECGTKIQTASELLAEIPPATLTPTLTATLTATSAPTSHGAATATIPCPACGAPHKDEDGNFCEICGYNFTTGTPADLPIVTLDPPKPDTPKPDTPTPIVTSQTGWTITIAIDPSLATPASPPAPTQPPIVVPLNQFTNLIGRTSAARGVIPEIPLDFDDAISHRHALLIVQPNETLIIRDIGSSNGVQYKGDDIPVMADIPIPSGDTFSLGHWTTITVTKQ